MKAAGALCVFLVLASQAFAQKYFALEPDIFAVGIKASGGIDEGYFPTSQVAVLGEKNSDYANWMLVYGRDSLAKSTDKTKRSSYKVIDSHTNEFGDIWPTPLGSALYYFKNSAGDTIYDNTAGAVVVLDSFSNDKKEAFVLFATLRRLIVAELKINSSGFVECSILKSIEMPEQISQATATTSSTPGYYRRLALLGTSKTGSDNVYHIATSNPYYKNGAYSGTGRIDFFSIRGNQWTISQPNSTGIVSGENGIFNQSTAMGIDLVSVGDLDGNGYNDLAVLLSYSEYFPNSALYIFFMDDYQVPDLAKMVTIAGPSMPWKEDGNTDYSQRCQGMSYFSLEDKPHLLLSCSFYMGTYSLIGSFIKDIILSPSGEIASVNIFASNNEDLYSNPVPIKNHKNNDFAVASPANGGCTGLCSSRSIHVYNVIDADAFKNFSIGSGVKDSIANIDSLFYRSGTSGYTAKALYGSAICSVIGHKLECEADAKARGSWSMVELSSSGNCDQYRVCKKKDTIFVYVRNTSDSKDFALRIPKNIVVPYFSKINLGNIKPLSYFRNPDILETDISWNTSRMKRSNLDNGSSLESMSIIPYSNGEGIDTLVFNLSMGLTPYNLPIRLHIADTSKILSGAIPATPGSDTVWNIDTKSYIALPLADSSGNIYTYDIIQDSLKTNAEVLGDYLHILKAQDAIISIAYTKLGEIKYRKITLMPGPKPDPEPDPDPDPDPDPSFVVGSQMPNFVASHINGGLLISGVNGDFELRAYNLKGMEIQREKVSAQGSAFVKLRYGGLQIVQIRTGSGKIHLKIAN
ncbi:MAG: hypothetical protein FWC26_04060 [Fibromonadales bacterium]|nr:hypothetical protein [Fibromonadales bacterium]